MRGFLFIYMSASSTHAFRGFLRAYPVMLPLLGFLMTASGSKKAINHAVF
jgi:hypothetical protein